MRKYSVFIFLALLIAVNVLQCFCTGLLFDESYYWVWSKHLAPGYFDHPPMIALFIAAGYSLWHNELGVRLFTILANAGTVYLLYRIIKPQNLKLFYVLLLSITPLLAAAFFAVPDMPLLFFVACFYLVYQKYVVDDTVPLALLLGLCMALMFYSKYHAVLVVFFVLLSDFSLLRRKNFYLACGLAAILFLPHLWWQWQNNFVTFRFHLFERVPEIYSWLRVTDYLGGQLLLAGIPTGLLLLYACIKQSSGSKFERALKFQLWGTYLFFFVSSFKGRTEANWTIANTIPLAVLSYRYFENNNRLSKWLYRLLPISVLAILFIRVHYGTDLTKRYLHVPSETQHWKAWADTIAQYAGDRPVVFLSSYQKASLYSFYAGKTGFSTTEVRIRKSQYNLMAIEDSIQNKQVFVCTYWGLWPERAISMHHIKTENTDFDGFVVDSFMSWMKVVITPLEKTLTVSRGEEAVLNVKVVSPYPNHPPPNNRSRLTYRIYKVGKWEKLSDNETGILLAEAFAKNTVAITVHMPEEPGQYMVFVSASQDNFPPPINSPAVYVDVK
jgi:hypothetical protein